jgi:hypothetical protein
VPPRGPGNENRTVAVGRTGTGKTVAGLWHLCNYPVDREPWVLIDFKRDKNINSIENLQEIGFDYVPSKKDDGVFIIHALPSDCKGTLKQKAPIDEYLTKLWERENIGIFVDEGYVIGECEGLELCLTQGRSKRIPMIGCTQRPVWISRFWFSEASFVQCFDLTDVRDKQTVQSFIPIDFDEELPLKKHQSFYYDVSEDELFRLNPCPDMTRIRDAFAGKLRRKLVRI